MARPCTWATTTVRYAAKFMPDIPTAFVSVVSFTTLNVGEFLTTGVCQWLRSMPADLFKPCCDHDIVGGDGTHIGVPVANAMHLQDIWRTSNQVPPVVDWGAAQRYIVRSDSISSPMIGHSIANPDATVRLAREFMSEVLDCRPGQLQLGLEDVRHRLQSCVAAPYVEETMRWLGMPVGSPERGPVKQLLKGICSKASASHMLFDAAVSAWDLVASRLDDGGTVVDIVSLLHISRPAFYSGGYGPQIWSILDIQLKRRSSPSQCAVDILPQSSVQCIALFGNVPTTFHTHTWTERSIRGVVVVLSESCFGNYW